MDVQAPPPSPANSRPQSRSLTVVITLSPTAILTTGMYRAAPRQLKLGQRRCPLSNVEAVGELGTWATAV